MDQFCTLQFIKIQSWHTSTPFAPHRPPTPSDRVLCTVLVTISWADHLVLSKLHSIHNDNASYVTDTRPIAVRTWTLCVSRSVSWTMNWLATLWTWNKSENAKKNLEAKLTQYEERLRTYDGQVSKEQGPFYFEDLSWNEQQIYLVFVLISIVIVISNGIHFI